VQYLLIVVQESTVRKVSASPLVEEQFLLVGEGYLLQVL